MATPNPMADPRCPSTSSAGQPSHGDASDQADDGIRSTTDSNNSRPEQNTTSEGTVMGRASPRWARVSTAPRLLHLHHVEVAVAPVGEDLVGQLEGVSGLHAHDEGPVVTHHHDGAGPVGKHGADRLD